MSVFILTCFTSTKVHILTPEVAQDVEGVVVEKGAKAGGEVHIVQARPYKPATSTLRACY